MRTGLSIVYVGLAVLANWLASRYLVVVPLTGGDVAPAGVLTRRRTPARSARASPILPPRRRCRRSRLPGQFWGKTEAIAVGVGLTLLRRVLVPVPSLAA